VICAAVIGSGNIGTDLMIKLLRSAKPLRVSATAGIDPASEGLTHAGRLGVATTADGAKGRSPCPVSTRSQWSSTRLPRRHWWPTRRYWRQWPPAGAAFAIDCPGASAANASQICLLGGPRAAGSTERYTPGNAKCRRQLAGFPEPQRPGWHHRCRDGDGQWITRTSWTAADRVGTG
jgi:hypothetical protein